MLVTIRHPQEPGLEAWAGTLDPARPGVVRCRTLRAGNRIVTGDAVTPEKAD